MAKRIHWRGHFGAAAEDAGDARLGQRRAVFLQPAGQGVEQLRRREHALDVVVGRQDGHRLVDDVFLVRLEVLHPALLDELDRPSADRDRRRSRCRRGTGRDARRPAAAGAGRTGRASASWSPWESTCSGRVSLNIS